VFAQQFLQPKLSRRRYASVSYALQNNTVFRRARNWVSVSDRSRTDNGIYSIQFNLFSQLCNNKNECQQNNVKHSDGLPEKQIAHLSWSPK